MSEDKSMDKVLITSKPSKYLDGHYIAEATTERGVIIAEHTSSSLEWSKIDMTNVVKIAKYGEYFPNGFEIIFNGEAVGKSTPKKEQNIYEMDIFGAGNVFVLPYFYDL